MVSRWRLSFKIGEVEYASTRDVAEQRRMLGDCTVGSEADFLWCDRRTKRFCGLVTEQGFRVRRVRRFSSDSPVWAEADRWERPLVVRFWVSWSAAMLPLIMFSFAFLVLFRGSASSFQYVPWMFGFATLFTLWTRAAIASDVRRLESRLAVVLDVRMLRSVTRLGLLSRRQDQEKMDSD
jgi:hypothetical protein